MSEKKTILQIINKIASEDDQSPVVLPLMCGAGKSQAISEKICEAIQHNEGLLVLTDRVSRLKEYLTNALNPKIQEYLDEHVDQVVIMQAAGIKQAHKNSQFCPVLLMTTQRYFSLQMEKIKEYLVWGEKKEKKRNLILIDEKPELYFQYDISLPVINQFEAAFVENAEDKHFKGQRDLIFNYWISVKASFLMHYAHLPNRFPDLQQYAFMAGTDVREEYEPLKGLLKEGSITSVSDYLSLNTYVPTNEELEMIGGLPRDGSTVDNNPVAEDDWQLEQYKDMISGKLCLLNEDEAFSLYINLHRGKIMKTNQIDPSKIVRAFKLLRARGTLFCMRPQPNGSKISYYSTIENEKAKIADTGAKVIILDGTADITLDYHQDYLRFDYEDCKLYDRKIPNLHIKLVKYQFSRKYARTINIQKFKQLEDIVRKDSGADEVCIFTYKAVLKMFETDFQGEDDEQKLVRRDYLGNLKGRNDFQTYHAFAQIGLNYKPPSYYLSIMIEQNPGLRKALMDSANREGKGDIDIINDFMKSSLYRSAVMNDILADTEQNIFRCPIRNPKCSEDVYYYLFFDYDSKMNQGLKDLIYKRFHDRYGAEVSCIDPTQYLKTHKTMNRKSKKGETQPQKIIVFLRSLPDGSEFHTSDILAQTHLSQKQFNKVKENKPMFQAYFKECSVPGKKGVYIKKPIKDFSIEL